MSSALPKSSKLQRKNTFDDTELTQLALDIIADMDEADVTDIAKKASVDSADRFIAELAEEYRNEMDMNTLHPVPSLVMVQRSAPSRTKKSKSFSRNKSRSTMNRNQSVSDTGLHVLYQRHKVRTKSNSVHMSRRNKRPKRRKFGSDTTKRLPQSCSIDWRKHKPKYVTKKTKSDNQGNVK
eukprot:294368_1